MGDHPPTIPDRAAVSTAGSGRRWRALIICLCGAVVVTLGCFLMLRPEVIEATSPTVTTDPAGIFVSFNRGQWSKAVVVVNGAYTFDAGSIMPGDHVIAWNRFQGPSIVLSQPMVKLITLRGEVDGKPREIDYHTSMGAGYVATFHVGDE